MRKEKLELLKRILKWSKRKENCLICYTNLSEKGVPRVRFLGKKYKAHRLIMFLMGKINLNDSNILILHSLECKSRACIEFSHLRIGTQWENIQDCKTNGKFYAWGRKVN